MAARSCERAQEAKAGLIMPYLQVKNAQRRMADGHRRHGHSGRQAEDDCGGSDRQVSLGLARSAHRDQPMRVLGRNLSEREFRRTGRAPDAGRRRSCRSAFPRFLESQDRPAAQTAGGVRLPDVDAGFAVEPHAGAVHALRRRSAAHQCRG